MTKSTITREQAQKIIVAADEVITALAGTNEDVHPDDSKKMCELWDDLNDRHAPPVVVRELARMALAVMGSEPVIVVGDDGGDALAYRRLIQSFAPGTKLYLHAQPAPVVPDGYVMVPMRLTAENGAKGALSGEFSETKFVNCPECFGDDECETCDGSGRIEITVPVTWTTIKEIWAKGVEHFAAAPQEVK